MFLSFSQQIRRFSVDGFGRVLVGNKVEKLVKNLREGDNVLTPYGLSKILRIEKREVVNGYYEMVEMNRMLITPDNMVEIYGEWTLPRDVKKINFVKCDCLYDLELDRHKVVTINGNNVMTK